MLRLSKLTDYAVVVLTRLARDGATLSGPVQTALSLAADTGIAEPTVAKVLKILAQAGLVEGVRGPRGVVTDVSRHVRPRLVGQGL